MSTLTEIYGLPGTGKTHLGHNGWPDPLHLDTAITQMSFGSIETFGDNGKTGESWEVILKLYDWDETAASNHYQYVTSIDDIRNAIQRDDGAHETIVFDNTYDVKAFAVKGFIDSTNQDWLRKEQWGKVNDEVDEITQIALNNDYHVVWVTQMKDEYRHGDKTGEKEPDGPKRAGYRCDFRLELTVDDDRHVLVRKNRYVDPTDEDAFGSRGDDLGSSTSHEELMMLSGIPDERW